MKRSSDRDAVVTGIRKCLYSRRRSRVFEMTAGMTKEERGEANLGFGWYGAAADDVGRTNDGALGAEDAHGVGVHLSPPHFPYASSRLSEADENGEKRIVLCRIIMGNSERVDAGSAQYHPSTGGYDSGVDDLRNPKWYIIWSTHMNTHILPEYIVSFKPSTQRQGIHAAVNSTAMTTRRWPSAAQGLSFQKLLSEMGRSLPSSSTQALQMLYNKHKAGKMSKDAFIRCLRSVAGDKLLASTIKRMRGY
ncbi:uncharacterized protein A4U43_C03F23990 [Asparagus officinalis]|uniref:Inactive poly [ADP-ribose] polymerase SRO2 n=1 Tax=Asparagus officinalis TaxID=4686 RepID=A0A5P1FCL4_ASPOF|nr:probable inactive poly [ADP-ribose] polymerase SRO3 [Asparagus officinalis]ONK76108.1 uncharacterized protein A4U43_C03F23990 [Asparagus officinalis]